jgi:protein subunit release factor B
MKIDKDSINKRLKAVHVYEADLIEKYIFGQGPGGQKINKTASCVLLQHIPTGIVIKCQAHRSREANRLQARLELCKRLEKIAKAKRLKEQKEKALQRSQNRKPTASQKQKMIENKRHRSEKKRARSRPIEHD